MFYEINFHFKGHGPGAYLAEKFGGKIVLLVSLLVTSILTAFTPFSVKLGNIPNRRVKLISYFMYNKGEHVGLIILRLMMGLAAAPCFPSVGNLLSSWVPPNERGVSSAIVLGGVQVRFYFLNFLSTCNGTI